MGVDAHRSPFGGKDGPARDLRAPLRVLVVGRVSNGHRNVASFGVLS
jgi:hypothetical protein